MKRPTKLYRFNTITRCDVHVLGPECAPQMVDRNQFGTLWRCRSGVHDHYGYDQRKAAKAEEIWNTQMEIRKLEAHLRKLTGED